MADTKKQKYKDDLERLSKAKQKHKKEITKPLKQWRDYYKGNQWAIDGLSRYNDQTVDNIVYGIVSTFVSSLHLGDIRVSVKPKTALTVIDNKQVDSNLGAMRHEVLSTFLYDELEVEDTLEKILVDAFLGHRGIVMSGYEAKTKEIENDDASISEIIDSQSLFVDRISPYNFFTDVDADDPDLKGDKRVYHRWVKTPEEVKDDTGKVVKPNGQFDEKDEKLFFESDTDRMTAGSDSDVWGRVEGFDIWDIEKHEIRTIVEGEDDYIEIKEWPVNYPKNKFPFDILWFNYMPDESTPLADSSLYKTTQDNINIIHSKINDHLRKLSDQKYGYNKNKVQTEDFEKWARSGSGAGLPCKGDPQTAVFPMNDGGVSNDLYANVQQSKNDVNGMLGLSSFETGGTPDFNSAEEAKGDQAGVAGKRVFRSKKYRKFIRNIVVKLGFIAAQVLPETEIPLDDQQFESLVKKQPSVLKQKPTGQVDENGEELIEVFPFTTMDKELLTGDFIYDVSIIPTGPESEQKKRQDAELLYQKALTDPIINKIEALNNWFEAFGFNHLKSRLIRDPQEVAKEQAAAQQAQIEAQIAIDKPKRTTDLEKTKMKTMAQLTSTGMQLDQKENEGNRKFVTANRDRKSNEDMSTIDKLFTLASPAKNGDK